MMTIPDQCSECIKRDICAENECFKKKPCLTRQEPKPVDADLMEEMKERMEIVR